MQQFNGFFFNKMHAHWCHHFADTIFCTSLRHEVSLRLLLYYIMICKCHITNMTSVMSHAPGCTHSAHPTNLCDT